jgi:DNA-directed RNA polymerase specialized sigma24 family protein
MQEVLREEPGITQTGFARLLALLDEGIDSNGERYLEVRRRLVSYFDRRGRSAADELADETLNRVARTLARIEAEQGRAVKEHRLDCLDRCLQELKPAQRELIVEYYAEERRLKIERRRDLAQSLGITMNALGIRALRIRDGLMACIGRCGPGAVKDFGA